MTTVRFVELSPFASRRPKRLADEAYQKLLLRLGQYPDSGDEVSDTDGWRAVRWADRGGSKRGGIRTVHYFYAAPDRIYLGNLYSTSEKNTLTDDTTTEMDAIESATATPAREAVYDGRVLTEIREDGETIWRLADARSEETEDVEAIREALRQTQEGLADLLGVKLSTVRNWEQKRRQPRGPAARLIEVVAQRPDVLLELRKDA